VQDQKKKQVEGVMTSAQNTDCVKNLKIKVKYTFGVKSNRFITGSRGKDTEREMYKAERNAVHQKQRKTYQYQLY